MGPDRTKSHTDVTQVSRRNAGTAGHDELLWGDAPVGDGGDGLAGDGALGWGGRRWRVGLPMVGCRPWAAMAGWASWWGSVVGDLGGGGAGGGLVDDPFAVGEGGYQGLDGEVVDRAGDVAGSLVDERDGVVAEQRVASAGAEVVGQALFRWT
jgi:hypothetical protein